jgi:hypothetical protein
MYRGGAATCVIITAARTFHGPLRLTLGIEILRSCFFFFRALLAGAQDLVK